MNTNKHEYLKSKYYLTTEYTEHTEIFFSFTSRKRPRGQMMQSGNCQNTIDNVHRISGLPPAARLDS